MCACFVQYGIGRRRVIAANLACLFVGHRHKMPSRRSTSDDDCYLYILNVCMLGYYHSFQR